MIKMIKPNELLKRIKNDDIIWFKEIILNYCTNPLSLINEYNIILQNKYGSSLIHLCSQYDSYKIGEYLLNQFYANANDLCLSQRNNDDKTPLHISCTYESINITKIFLKYNNNIINQLKRGDWTSLMIAIVKENIPLIKLLLDNNADDLIKNKDGWTVLHLAIRTGNLEILKLLLSYRKTINYWPDNVNNGRNIIHIAAINGHINIFNYLLNHIIDINRLDLLNMKDNCGITPIMDASRINCISIIEIILNHLDYNICLKQLDNCKRNILHHCAQSNAYKSVKYLYNKYPLIITDQLLNQCDHWKQTPIYLAIRDNNIEMIELLFLKLNCNINNKDINNRTPLDYCYQYNYQNLIDLFEKYFSNN